MRNLTKRLLGWLSFGVVTFLLSGCLHIVEEVTVRKDGSGSYKMTMDMSEVKSMMEALKNMGEEESEDQEEQTPDEETPKTDSDEEASDTEGESSMAQLGTEISSVSQSLRGIAGLTNVKEINDTSTYMFGYSFDFANIEALNKAIRVIQREKYETKVEETFRLKGGTFERLNVADMGEQFKKTLTETEEADEEGSMDMVKAFFSGMTYKQVYRFPDAKVKKSSNPLSELSGDGQSVSILIKPLDEEQQKKKPSVATVVKLK